LLRDSRGVANELASVADTSLAMDFFVIDFIAKWIRDGRFPREELRIRWWIGALGSLVALALLVALLTAR
jgi:hypothetical protein